MREHKHRRGPRISQITIRRAGQLASCRERERKCCRIAAIVRADRRARKRRTESCAGAAVSDLERDAIASPSDPQFFFSFFFLLPPRRDTRRDRRPVRIGRSARRRSRGEARANRIRQSKVRASYLEEISSRQCPTPFE